MTEAIRHVLSINDHPTLNATHAHVFADLFPDVRFLGFSNVSEALTFLNENPDIPNIDVLLLDCTKTGADYDGQFGYKNACAIVEWHRVSNRQLPRYVLFQSADRASATRTSTRFEDDGGIPSFAVDRNELELTRKFLASRPVPSDVELSGFRRFVHQTLGLSIPETPEALEDWKLKNKIWEIDDLIALIEQGKISRGDGLMFLSQKATEVSEGLSNPIVSFDGSLIDKVDDRYLSLDFAKSVGTAVNGYAAFSLEDVEILLEQGKKPVLFLPHYDARIIAHLKNLAAIAFTNNDTETAHMVFLLESHGVTGLFGFELSDKPSPQLNLGDPVTVTGGRVFQGHHKISENAIVDLYPWLSQNLYWWIEAWQLDHGIKPLCIKANIDYSGQQTSYARGIGLLRTEHFVLAKPEQLALLKDICLRDDMGALGWFAQALEEDLAFSPSHFDDGHPYRIRLLDAPPSEFYTKDEQAVLEARFGADAVRGAQLAVQIPHLYEAQLSGIFAALEKGKTETYFQGLEILVPTVRTADELQFARALTRNVAARYGTPDDVYKFGSMLETVEACKNIAEIAPHCSFISIGTNDLTSEVLGCARDDWEQRHAILLRDGIDPFVKIHPRVLDMLVDAVAKARAVNPDIQVDLCGAHACDLDSLERMRVLNLDGVSVPPNTKNTLGLHILYGYNRFFEYRENHGAPQPIPRPEQP